MTNKEYKFLSWQDIEDFSVDIYNKMIADKYCPQSIIGLLRGGVVPARIFSDLFGIKFEFYALDVKLYQTIGIRNPEPVLKPFQGDIHNKKILIIDDICDSGITMASVLKELDGEDITTATLFWKEATCEKPDYYSEIAKENEWIVFPWEKQEFKREMRTIDESS